MQSKCRYDIIYGCDYCSLYSIVLDFANHEINAHNATIKMQDKISNVTNNISLAMSISHDHHDTTMIREYEDTNTTVINGYKSKTFTSTLSKKGDLVEIISQQKHLGSSEKNELLTTLQHHKELFNGELGTFKPYEIELELKPDALHKAS